MIDLAVDDASRGAVRERERIDPRRGYAFMKANLAAFPLAAVCRVLGLSTSGYNDWLHPSWSRWARLATRTTTRRAGASSRRWSVSSSTGGSSGRRPEVRSEVISFTEGFYNTRRLPSALGYESEAKFEKLNMRPEANPAAPMRPKLPGLLRSARFVGVARCLSHRSQGGRKKPHQTASNPKNQGSVKAGQVQ